MDKITKTCSRCGEAKELKAFGKNKNTKDGFTYWCKQCKALSDKRYITKSGGGKRTGASEIDRELFHNGKKHGRPTKIEIEIGPLHRYPLPPPIKRKVQYIPGYIYIIEFSTGVIKVGRTGNKTRRIAEHKSLAIAMGISTTNVWTSNYIHNSNEVEQLLIDWCCEHSNTQSRREYFTGTTYSQVVAQSELITKPVPPSVRN